MSDPEVDYVFTTADKDGDGKLQYDEMKLAVAVWYCSPETKKGVSAMCIVL